MNRLGQIIKQRRHAMGFTLAQTAELAGTTKSYLSMIETGRVDNPPSTTLLEQLEQALQLDGGQLVQAAQWQAAPRQMRETIEQLTEDAQRGRDLAQWLREATSRRSGGSKNLDKLYRSGQLSKKLKQTLKDFEPSPDKAPAMTLPDKVPLVNKVAAGYPKGFTDLDYPARIADDYIVAPRGNDPDAFAATVVGDSMLPEYREGDVMIFSPLADINDGCDCFARIEPEHETTFKRIYFEEDGQQIRLQPLNPKYPPRVLPREEVAGLYRAIWRMSKL